MDPNPFSNPPVGYLIIGLVAVLLLAGIIYALGAWGAGRMRERRIEDSTAIPYPDQPGSADDRETVSHARAEGAHPDRIVAEADLADRALGADRKIVPQTPTRGERPVDAAERDRRGHQVGEQAGAASPASEQEQGDQSPL